MFFFFHLLFQYVTQFYRYSELNLTFPGNIGRCCEEELKILYSSQQAAFHVEDTWLLQ